MQSANCVCTSTGRIAKRQRRLRVLSVSAILHPCRRAVDSLPSAWLPPACRADHPLLPRGPSVRSYRQKVVAHLRARVRNLTLSRIAASAPPSRMTNESICPLPQQSPSAASLSRINHVVDCARRLGKMRRGSVALFTRRRPDRFAFRRVRPFAIAKIFSEQSKFPQLISNIFSDVGHDSIRTHNNLVLFVFVVFIGVFCAFSAFRGFLILFFFFPRHNPASGHLACSR